MNLAAGWDGGGSKTRVVCLAPDGTIAGEQTFGPLNPNGASVHEVHRTVENALAFCNRLGNCVSLVISAAGISNPQTEPCLRKWLFECGYRGALSIVGDQEAALWGAVGQTGTVLVSGTGSICFGRNKFGQTARCGGYGHLVDDEGSGYALGRDILSAVLRAGDRRAPATRLTELVRSKEGWKDTAAMMRQLYDPDFDKGKIAMLAPLLLDAGNDAVAEAIMRKAALELALLAATVIQRLNLDCERIAFTGSVLTHMQPLRKAVEASLLNAFPGLRGFEPLTDAATGAAQMALQTMV